jgi:hypothetical protein
MKTLPVIALLATLAACQAQDQTTIAKPKKVAKPTVDTKSPVTQAEAKAVFIKAATVLKPVIGGNFPAPKLANSAKAVSRAEVVEEFTRLFMAAKPAFKLIPRKVRFDAARLTLKDPAQRKNIERLIAFGAVAKMGPLAAGNKEELSVQEFGDAVGFLVARIAEVTHMPSAKWTPSLQE